FLRCVECQNAPAALTANGQLVHRTSTLSRSRERQCPTASDPASERVAQVRRNRVIMHKGHLALCVLVVLLAIVVTAAHPAGARNQAPQWTARTNKPRAGGPGIMTNNNSGNDKCNQDNKDKEDEERQQKTK
ncbi:hypothetical protein MRX96_057054, partial [Rhipicephalus microplus]